MLKKIVVGILLVTVVGAGGTALAYNAINQEGDETALEPLAVNASDPSSSAVQPIEELDPGDELVGAGNAAGNPWEESGLITQIDDNGFQFQLQTGESLYIELGPPEYWRNQGVAFQVGDSATVYGAEMEGMIHAERVLLGDGQTLQLRTAEGQPLWSGGLSAQGGGNAEAGDGDHTPDPQSQVEQWVTVNGTLLAFQGGSMTLSTAQGEVIAFQTGQPRFFSSQGITFQVGDEIVVVGYYQDGQFMAGDITQVSSGLRVLLRDPNGRPLWAGPGSGNGNGSGSQGSGGAGIHQ